MALMAPNPTTVWVLGDQLHRRLGPLADATPEDTRVLVVESTTKLRSKRWHVQRAHLVVSAMRHFTAELRAKGFDVDHRVAPTLAAGLAAHRDEHHPSRVAAMMPASWEGEAMLRAHGVDVVASTQFLCRPDEFAAWADGRKRPRMEDFYRWHASVSAI